MTQTLTKRIINQEIAAALRQADNLGGETRHHIENLRALALPQKVEDETLMRAWNDDTCSQSLSHMVARLDTGAAFHDVDANVLPEVTQAAEAIAAASGRRGLTLAIEAMPTGYRHELNLAFAGVRGWRPLKCKWA